MIPKGKIKSQTTVLQIVALTQLSPIGVTEKGYFGIPLFVVYKFLANAINLLSLHHDVVTMLQLLFCKDNSLGKW